MASAPAPRSAALPPLGLLGRLRLVAEILAFYPRALRQLRSNDLVAMVAAARAAEPEGTVAVPETEHPLALRLGVAVQRTLACLPTDSRCLIRSLVLTQLLARRAIDSTVVIGVTPGSDFAAHAWVEHDGQAVLPPGRHERLMEL